MTIGEGIASAVGSIAICSLLGLWLYLSHVETMAKMAAKQTTETKPETK